MFDLLGGRGLGPGVAVPDEWHDFCLMRGMNWSWRDLTGQKRTPFYVAEFCRLFLSMVNEKR